MKKLMIALISIMLISFNIFSQQIQYNNPIKDRHIGPYIVSENSNSLIYYFKDGVKFVRNLEGDVFSGIYEDSQIEYEINKIVTDPTSFSTNQKIAVLSDIHGQYLMFEKMLKKADIIDEETNWVFGKGNLVIIGDVFDRGPMVTECLWLIHNLEKQAENAGGKVHLLMGNHEIMVLKGDLRYIHEVYAKLDKDDPDLTITDLYAENTYLGKWLRSKNFITQINDYTFTHGGLSTNLMNLELDLDSINSLMRKSIDLSYEEIRNDSILSLLSGSFGPMWYRGYFRESSKYPKISQENLDYVLDKIKSQHIIVGHTTQDSISSSYNNKIIAVDSGFKYGDQGEILLIKNDRFYRISSEKGEIELK